MRALSFQPTGEVGLSKEDRTGGSVPICALDAALAECCTAVIAVRGAYE
jgi:hypothetical protein